MLTQLFIALTLAFGGLGCPIQIERVSGGEIFYGFGHTRYYGDCRPAIGPAYAEDVNLAGRHIFTAITTPGCVVAVKAG